MVAIVARTDDYGAVRAGAGLLISSYLVNHDAQARDPAGDNAPGTVSYTHLTLPTKRIV